MTADLTSSLPFLVQPHNVARYEDGTVYILDRRRYPAEQQFVACANYDEVAIAVADMVTQSGGPAQAVGWGMVQAAHQAKVMTDPVAFIGAAASRLGSARPTNNTIATVSSRIADAARAAAKAGEDLEDAAHQEMDAYLRALRARAERIGAVVADELLEDGDCVLTHCWAEIGIVYPLMMALDQGKDITAVCTETRPYLQGARLTADALGEIGIPVTVVTDAMPAHLMASGRISKFFTGSDRVAMDGSVINKIGTLGIALSAKHFDVPFYPVSSSGPDRQALTAIDVPIEDRDPTETLYCMGRRTATRRATGLYPAFDVTPAELITSIVTDRGIFAPEGVGAYFENADGVGR